MKVFFFFKHLNRNSNSRGREIMTYSFLFFFSTPPTCARPEKEKKPQMHEDDQLNGTTADDIRDPLLISLGYGI